MRLPRPALLGAVLLALSLTAGGTSASTADAVGASADRPGPGARTVEGWTVTTPARLGLRGKAVKRGAAEARRLDSTCFAVLRKNKVVGEWSWRLPREEPREVFSITTGDPVAGTVAVIKVDSLHFVVTERRKPYHHESDFTALGLEPRTADIVVVKIGYLEPELYDMAADWMMALTPGGVDQNLVRLGHHRIDRPMYPFDPEMERPVLASQVLRGR